MVRVADNVVFFLHTLIHCGGGIPQLAFLGSQDSEPTSLQVSRGLYFACEGEVGSALAMHICTNGLKGLSGHESRVVITLPICHQVNKTHQPVQLDAQDHTEMWG